MGKIPRIKYKGMELLPPKADLVFKALLTAGGDLELLASLLSCILGHDIHANDVAVANTELPRTHEEGKLASVDVRVRLADGRHVNVEMQVGDEHNITARSIYYASKLYTEQMKPRMDFSDICPAIAVNILDFHFLHLESCHNRYRLKNMEGGSELTDVFEIHFIELPKVSRKTKNGLKELWLLFFAAGSEEELCMLANEEPIIEKALNKLVYVSADEQLRYELDMREKFELDHYSALAGRERKGREEGMREGLREGRAEGMREGLREGREEGKREVVAGMRKKNFADDVIAGIVNLPIEEVRKIK